VLTVLLVVVFLALLVSAYSQYQFMLTTAGLVDTASSVTNDLVVNDLALERGGRLQEYVIDPGKISSLDFRKEIGGDNFEFQLKISYNSHGERVLGPYGENQPVGKAVAAIAVPVALYDNGRLTYARLEVKVWRA
jgi:hypothetical protein